MTTEENTKYTQIIQKLLDIEKNSSNVIVVLLAKIKRVRELKKWYELKYNRE